MKKPPVTSGYREINRPLDFVCLGQMRRGLKRSVPPKLDFASSQTILFVLTSSETIRNSRNTALLSVFAYGAAMQSKSEPLLLLIASCNSAKVMVFVPSL